MKIFVILAMLLAAACSSVDSEQVGSLKWTDRDDYPAWKGERKSFRAELNASVDLEDVRVQISDLKCGGSRIKGVEAQFMSYVMADAIDTTQYDQCRRPVGKFDSLYVAEIIDIVGSKDVPAGTVQPFWVKVSVPQDAPAGVYRGTLTVRAKGDYKWSLPLELSVVDETLPEPNDWKFHLDLWQNPYSVARYHGVELWSREHFEYMRPVMKMLADAGQKVVTATILDRPWNGQTEDAFESMVRKTRYEGGRWEYDFSVFDKWVEFMFSLGIDKQINCYSMIPWKLTFDYIDGETGEMKYVNAAPGDAEYAFYWDSFIRAFAKHLREKGWFEKTMIAMDERPMEAMMLAMDVIKSAEPEFKVSLAGNYHDELAYSLDDYCIASLQKFPEDVVAGRKAKGLVTTIYTCCQEAHPNLFVASDPDEPVWIAMYVASKGYDGYLHWAYNSWTVNPLEDSRFGAWPAGDCFVVYPEGRSGVHFEKLVEGIQEFEKIRILKERWTAEGNDAGLDALEKAFGLFVLEELLKNGPEDAINAVKDVIN